MEYQFAVHFSIMKGLGPDFVPHTEFVFFDDVDPETTDWQLRQMAIYEAEDRIRKSDTVKFIFESIEEA